MIYLHLFATWCILEDRPFFCWDCCAVEIEAPEIVEDGRGRTRRGLACLLEELSLGPRWSVHRCPQCGYCLRFASSVPQFHILSHPFTSFHRICRMESTLFSPYFLAFLAFLAAHHCFIFKLCAKRPGSTSKISTPMVYSKSRNSLSWTSSLLSSIMAQISIATFLKRSTERFFEAWNSWIALQPLQLYEYL